MNKPKSIARAETRVVASHCVVESTSSRSRRDEEQSREIEPQVSPAQMHEMGAQEAPPFATRNRLAPVLAPRACSVLAESEREANDRDRGRHGQSPQWDSQSSKM